MSHSPGAGGASSTDRPELDTSVPHSARVWNHWLGGKDNYAVDREVGEQLRAMMPDVIVSARADREFLQRAVTYLVREAGLRQFLDLGTGLPTADNTHEVAQRLAPESRVVYVDNDPLVLVHAQALLVGTPEGATDYVSADVHDPGTVLREAARTLDFTRPVGLMMLGILNYVIGADEARSIVGELMGALPSGSHLVIGHPTADYDPEGMAELLRIWNSANPAEMRARNRTEVAALLDGLEPLEPGVVPASRWRPTAGTLYADRDVSQLCAVARKP
ncbi:SAM-dependent methyltransferase [Streptomonospora sp. PA3]|uniref:SAM-dependent methyltransferase n=1 Tax=Streptomonospora sp. PA3 TaxID=2607326 RepID=UPI0012DD66CC|nr:SAM-dependent methyltransferase [Streptomonospora sp. PA3]MUL42945.1 SAM-dependent methyltransferase [Streptomonospora sp. PA3]